MPKILVIRAEKGRIVESKIVEGELEDIVRKTTLKALEEWNPEKSDFIVIKEKRKIETTQPVLEKHENLEIGENNVQLPIYMISFDNTMIDEDNYLENKIYLITFYANEEIKELLEIEASDITMPAK